MKTRALNRMALSKQTLKLMKYLYWIILTLGHLYVCYLLLVTNRAIAGIIWLIVGFVLIFVMYPYYFTPGDPGSQWPPYISACPDYLTLIAPNKCVDYVGLHSMLVKSDPLVRPNVSDQNTYNSRVFDSKGSVADKAARAQMLGLSWEGIA